MFPPPVSRNKNKKHLSILAHSPNPLLHSSTSELSPLFSPAEFLELLHKDDGVQTASGQSKPSPFGSLPSSSSPFSPGMPSSGDGPFRFSLEVDAFGHASMLPLQLPEAGRGPFSPPIISSSAAGDLHHGCSQLPPVLMNPPVDSAVRVATPAGASAAPKPPTSFSPPPSSALSLSPLFDDNSPSFNVFPGQDYGGLGVSTSAVLAQSTSASLVDSSGATSISSPPPRRPSLFACNSAPAVPLVQRQLASPPLKARSGASKKRSSASLRADIARIPASTSPSLAPKSATSGTTTNLANLLPIVPRDEIVTSKKNHNAAKSANYTPRPPNSWILYRSETIKQMKLAKERGETFPIPDAVKNHPDIASSEGVMAQADVSKMVALMWKLEGKEVKLKYDQLSAIRKLEHAEMYPGYKYQPTRKVTSAPPIIKTKPSKKPGPPLVQYPSTKPRTPLLSPPMTASPSASSAPPSSTASGKDSSGRKTLRKKKSRSNLSSRAHSPSQLSPPTLPQSVPIEWSQSLPGIAYPWTAPTSPGSAAGWAIPPPADAPLYAHPQQTISTPPDYPSFGVPQQVWVNPQSSEGPSYYPPYPAHGPPASFFGTPQGQSEPPVSFNAFAVQSPDYSTASSPPFAVHRPSYPPESFVHPGHYAQLSPPPPPAQARPPEAIFDGVAYTQVISDTYLDPEYLAPEGRQVDGQSARGLGESITESSLAATWSLLEEEDDTRGQLHDDDLTTSIESASGVSWSSQGEWTIDVHQPQWTTHAA